MILFFRASNKGLSSEYPKAYKYNKRHMKKTGEYSVRNAVSIATKMSITVCIV